jgi:hypothetical protein
MSSETNPTYYVSHSIDYSKNSSYPNHQNGRSIESLDNVNNSNNPNCDCGINCKIVTVSKEGPNTGRNFFTCIKTR